ncbi:hypothetical protein CkaCkLH20_03792 [Colletotrichum karsti]|uniref:Uncharacterized protein n=1 Tax=Colletotrichum karsti TaxID=1095194 RepID=A0A9P6I8M4_9PEZI|nr:uncharacterized protein CkaCkLH20_03792 [Colletotrichum karsti]KAF9878892.1 hypothetical protein CkaCkLH20_03792 [Colletotrichum karsti]
MVASQPQRGWELQDQPTPPPATFDQKPRGMPGYGPSQHNTEAPRWPFQDVEDDDTKHPPPPPPPAAPPTLQPPPQVPPYQQHQPSLSPRPPSHTRHILRYWALELATVFTAICLLVAIIALLAHYDGKYMPEWPFEINLNSAIAFLSTFLRAAIVAAVAEIIGQIKWTWFAEQTRPLHHLQDFDAASRSILGSMKLLGVLVWNLGFSQAGLLAIGAALVTIASLAVGPVTQQAVRTTTCPVLSQQTNSSIPVANYVPGSSSYYRVGAGSYELEVDMKSTMIQGITDPGSQDSNVQVVCPSGNCTWSDWGTGVTHASIGMCSKCIDTTEFVSKPNLGGNLTLPDNGAYINILAGQYMWVGYSNLTAYSKLFSDEFAAAADVSLANFTMLMVTKSPCSSSTEPNGAIKLDCPHSMSQSDDNDYLSNAGDYIATSCVLYPCLKEYAAHYENNTLTEKLVRTTTAVQNAAEMAGTGYYSGYANYTAIQSPCVLDNGTWYNNANQSQALDAPGRTWANISAGGTGGEVTRVPNACLYKMQGTFFSALSNFMSGELFTASCRYDSMQSGHINCRDAWWLTPLWAENNATVASLTAAVDDFAWAVTNKLRMTGLGPDVHQGLGALVRHAEVLGEVWASTTCTYFDSKYLALPIVLVLLCAILLGWIIAKNYTDPEQPVWKGSVLPLLFFGLHNGAGPGTAGGGGGARDGNGEPRGGGGLARNMSFFREGRSAPELDRIQHESGRLWVRFHGGTDPGFLDLGTKGRRIDVEAIDTALGSGNASKGESRGRSTIR